MPRGKGEGNGSSGDVGIKALGQKWSTDVAALGGARWSWDNVDFHLLFELIHVVTRRNGAVMFGEDRQGVGGTLAVWLGGEKVLNKWLRPSPEGYQATHELIEEFIQDVTNLPD